jgi:hypothetical protein
MAKDRSPKSPRNSLRTAIVAVEKLFKAAKRAPVGRDNAAKAMGYSGLTGVSLTVLASLAGYGLIQRKGQEIVVSELAISILHAMSDGQRLTSLQKAALEPPLFASLAEDYLEVSASVLASKLVQMGFAPDSAKKTASVFLENAEYAELTGASVSGTSANESEDEDGNEDEVTPYNPFLSPRDQPASREVVLSSLRPQAMLPSQPQPRSNVLATYKIPLGANEAELVFTGEKLEPEDFDALIDYVEIFKKQFTRKLPKPAPVQLPPPLAEMPSKQEATTNDDTDEDEELHMLRARIRRAEEEGYK